MQEHSIQVQHHLVKSADILWETGQLNKTLFSATLWVKSSTNCAINLLYHKQIILVTQVVSRSINFNNLIFQDNK